MLVGGTEKSGANLYQRSKREAEMLVKVKKIACLLAVRKIAGLGTGQFAKLLVAQSAKEVRFFHLPSSALVETGHLKSRCRKFRKLSFL